MDETTVYLLMAMIFTLFIGTLLAINKLQQELDELKRKKKVRK
jgi:hypothetical protein